MKSEIVNILRHRFGLESFREGQREAIESLLSGNDVVAVLPTGGGKSLLYQLPAVVAGEGVALVISPLIALMHDQVQALDRLGIEAMYCNSTQEEPEQMRALSRAVTGKIRLLYISPERALSRSFLSLLPRMRLSLIAIDEAHCVSQWGHEFRPEYRQLAKLRESGAVALRGGRVPLIAVTATATPHVRRDIMAALGLVDPLVVLQSFRRPELAFRLAFPQNEREATEQIIARLDQSGFRQRSRSRSCEENSARGRAILYCATRARVDGLYKELKELGFPVACYHAGRTELQRRRAQEAYSSAKLPLLVATNAFGMGLDQPDVRLVVHVQTPASPEAYYQEAGRAGRDGRAAEALLFYREADLATQRYILSKESREHQKGELLLRMRDYALTTICRQNFFESYFTTDSEASVVTRDGNYNGVACGVCDNCLSGGAANEAGTALKLRLEKRSADRAERAAVELSAEQCQAIHDFVAADPDRHGILITAKALRGSLALDIRRRRLDRSAFHGLLKSLPEEAIVRAIEQEVLAGRLRRSSGKYPKLSPSGYKRTLQPKVATRPTTASGEQQLYRTLQLWRDRTARRLKWKKFMVIQNAALRQIAKELPTTIVELSAIRGIGQSKIEKFGAEIIEIVSDHYTKSL